MNRYRKARKHQERQQAERQREQREAAVIQLTEAVEEVSRCLGIVPARDIQPLIESGLVKQVHRGQHYRYTYADSIVVQSPAPVARHQRSLLNPGPDPHRQMKPKPKRMRASRGIPDLQVAGGKGAGLVQAESAGEYIETRAKELESR